MFAGAAREAVFSNPEVVRRINADFVPVALKAALVNKPPEDEEGQLYREIGRSKIAPQGICVANSAGKVLDWVMMFDDDKSVLAFLDHAQKRFAKYPDAKQPVPAERYMKFPSNKLEDVKDDGKAPVVIERHPNGKSCPAKPLIQRGTVGMRVFGRALDKDGKPLADTVRQEQYVEDRFHLTVAMQESLAKALADVGTKRFRLPNDLERLFANHAYLGQLDVNPVAAPGGKGELKHCEFWVKKDEVGAKGLTRLRVEGKSEAAGASRDGSGDGRLWQHEVRLTWQGIIDVKEKRIARILLLANGSEKLKWGTGATSGKADVGFLPAGHAIDLACNVRYGLIGEPLPDAETSTSAPVTPFPVLVAGEVPEEARAQLVEVLGPQFLVFRAKVQQELNISDAQKTKLQQRLQETLQETMQLMQKLEGVKQEERERELGPYRQKAQEKLASYLKDTLQAGQMKRLHQLALQHEGTIALGQPDVAKELKITDEQRKQFMALVQQLEKQVQPLVKEAEAGGQPDQIRPKVLKVRKEYESKIAVLLTDAQKRQWQEMLGKPFDPGHGLQGK